MLKFTVFLFFFGFLFLSCSKTALTPVPLSSTNTASRTPAGESEKTVANVQTTWFVQGGDFVWTNCTAVKPVRSDCGDAYRGGITTQSNGVYATLLTVEIRRCDGQPFTKQKNWQALVRKDNLCGDVVGKAAISPNYQYVTVTFNITQSDTTKYYPTILTPAGKKFYSNPLVVIPFSN